MSKILSFFWYIFLLCFTDYEYPSPEGYKFKDTLGYGSCGKVYLAENCLTGCPYAVKCVKIIDPYTAVVSSYAC